MTPNPHPASGNCDVIERAAEIIAAEFDCPNWSKEAEPYKDGYRRVAQALASAGLLKLSEGSGDGKMREALTEMLRLFGKPHKEEYVDGGASYNEALRVVALATEALAATPAPSPNIGGGMSTPACNPNWREDEFDQPSPIDAAGMRVHVKTSSYEIDGTVLARFKTTKGADRVVVEFDQPKGLLHIHNPDQLSEALPTREKLLAAAKKESEAYLMDETYMDGARFIIALTEVAMSDWNEAMQDLQYTYGYAQAWREWSDCAKSFQISENDRAKLEASLASINARIPECLKQLRDVRAISTSGQENITYDDKLNLAHVINEALCELSDAGIDESREIASKLAVDPRILSLMDGGCEAVDKIISAAQKAAEYHASGYGCTDGSFDPDHQLALLDELWKSLQNYPATRSLPAAPALTEKAEGER